MCGEGGLFTVDVSSPEFLERANLGMSVAGMVVWEQSLTLHTREAMLLGPFE